ncbi:MAG TPA: hypothetical protein VGE98_01470 [Thermoanaerobaculia bacterium]
MRNLSFLVLLPGLLAIGCASAANPSMRRAEAPPDYQAINEDLEGDSATVELAGGEVIQKALWVSLGPQTSSWRDAAGNERSVPTADVRRVLQEPRHLLGRGFGYGALAALVPTFIAAEARASKDASLDGFAAVAVGVPIGGLLGMAVAESIRHPVVVYEARHPEGEVRTSAALDLHCRLLPPSANGSLDCAPRAR